MAVKKSPESVDLTELNRRIAEEAAAVTTAEARNKAAAPAASKSDDVS